MFGKEIKSGEGYLVEDACKAEKMFSDYAERGFKGIYIFKGSPHFFPENAKFFLLDNTSRKEILENIEIMLHNERCIVLLDGDFLFGEDQEALRFLCLLKDYVIVSGSCMILYLDSRGGRLLKFIERELVRIQ